MSENSELNADAAGDDFVDVRTACAIIGGSKPVHPSTLWRAVREGRLPKPVHIGRNSIRFIRAEVLAAKAAMIAARDDPVAQAEIARRNEARTKARADADAA